MFIMISNIMFRCRQVHIRPPERFDHQEKANIERRGEGDRGSDLNRLDSMIPRQYTTVTNQC